MKGLRAGSVIELGEGQLVPTIRCKIGGIQPALKVRFTGRPLGVQHGKPCAIPIPAFHDHMLPENALERETQTQRRAS